MFQYNDLYMGVLNWTHDSRMVLLYCFEWVVKDVMI